LNSDKLVIRSKIKSLLTDNYYITFLLIDRLVFNANLSSISAISGRSYFFVLFSFMNIGVNIEKRCWSKSVYWNN